MSWLTRLIERPKKILGVDKESGTSDTLWIKCSGCSDTLYNKELMRSDMVCPRCGKHMRISTQNRALFLFDEASYEECDTNLVSQDVLQFKDQKKYSDRLKAANKKAGKNDAARNYIGDIEGITTSVTMFEFAYMGGSMGSVVGEKIVLGMERAIERGCPYLLITASGGARMQEGILSLMQMAKTSSVTNRLNEAKIPFVCLLTDPTMGGVSASVAWLGDVILAEPDALIGFAGPRVIQETVAESLPEGFQRSEFLMDHGLIDDIVDRREQRAYLKTLFEHLLARSYRQAHKIQ